MKKIILIDGNSLMYRAYYATAYSGNLMKTSKGLYTNAVYAFINMMNHILKTEFSHILVAFDAGKKTFRHEFDPNYKAGRSPMPEELLMQIPYIKKYLELSGIKSYELSMYEADDIIGTMAKKASNDGIDVEIYSSDKDLLQLVNNQVKLHMPRKGMTEIEVFDPIKIMEKYGLTYHQMIDLKALMGDPSDNLKGIMGVGEKTAIKLLQDYQSLENIIEGKNHIKGKLGERIKEGYQDALLCKKMVTINQDSPINLSLEETFFSKPNDGKLNEMFQELEFNSFLKKAEKHETIKITYKVIENLDNFLSNENYIYLETTQTNYHNTEILGMAIVNEFGNFFISNLINIKTFLEDEKIKKSTFACKKTYVVLKKLNIDLKGIEFDALLGSYVIDPKMTKNDLNVIANNYGYQNVIYDDVLLKKVKDEIIKTDEYIVNAVNKALIVKYLKPLILERLDNDNLSKLFSEIEMPLAKVLADMEFEGIKISIEELKNQRKHLSERIIYLEDSIYKIVGKEFNISSVKQLGEVLFETLKLPVIKKTKTGYSTDVDVLEALYDKHEIIQYLLEYRKLTKIFSTYIEGIKNYLDNNCIVHTIYEQALTETGRLSSIEPNIQNIPIRTEEGAIVRKIFISNKDLLLSADYSQIELRILAHIADVKKLKDAFKANVDIHEQTAKAVFGKTEVSKSERRAAKAVNFGIVYGISPWGLSNQLGINPKEASDFIDKYFSVYPEIKEYTSKIVEEAITYKYTKTIMQRRRYITELESSNYQVREFGKRNAMNSPIQGSAADIIKKAMIDIYNEMKKLKLKSKMILQVHDELIFDCVNEEIDIMQKLVKEKMENAVKLDVDLLVEIGIGKSWFDTK